MLQMLVQADELILGSRYQLPPFHPGSLLATASRSQPRNTPFSEVEVGYHLNALHNMTFVPISHEP